MTSEEASARTSGPGPEAGEVPADATAAGTERAYYLIVAEYRDTTAAASGYEALRQLEATSDLRISGVVVARRDAKGDVSLEQMTEHSTRNGLGWGIVGGIVVGVLFPPSILAGAIGTGVLGAAIGKVRNVNKRSEFAKELEDSLEPGTSGIIALVDEQAAVEVRRTLAGADRIVSRTLDSSLALGIEAEAARAREAEAAMARNPEAIRDQERFSHV